MAVRLFHVQRHEVRAFSGCFGFVRGHARAGVRLLCGSLPGLASLSEFPFRTKVVAGIY